MKTFKKIIEKPMLEITYEPDVDSPRTWRNGSCILTTLNAINDEQVSEFRDLLVSTGYEAKNAADHFEKMRETLENWLGSKIVAVYQIEKHEHGGIALSLKDLSNNASGWDNSNIGFIFVTKKYCIEMGLDTTNQECIIKRLEMELSYLNKWINGKVLAYRLYDENGELEDALCGLYSIEEIRANLPKEWKNETLTDYFVD